jgi:hypothetical protein
MLSLGLPGPIGGVTPLTKEPEGHREVSRSLLALSYGLLSWPKRDSYDRASA